MCFQRFYDKPLAQASYMVGCQRTGQAIVVDPNRDVQQYLDAAAKEGLRVTHVTETHIHADFVSGVRELAARTGAKLLLSDEGDGDWKYAFAAADGARLLRDGDHIMVGNIRFDVMHTPGHTPEHLSFVVTDTPAASGPWGIITGDFVFVGDAGRPDLLEKAAGHSGTMEASARTLFQSLQRFRALPDHLQVWPGHGAGSACGKALGAVASSTVGYEKISNWAVAATDEGEFVRMVLDGQPAPPAYFAEMKRVNKAGPRVLGGFPAPATTPSKVLAVLLDRSAAVVDTRPAAAFAVSHVPGTLNIPLGGSFITWAGWLLPYDRPLYVLVDDACADCTTRAVRDLAMIGLDRIAGVINRGALEAWRASGRTFEAVAQLSAADLKVMLDRREATVIDVRTPAEWAAGHLPGVLNIPLGQLADRLHEVPQDKPVVVHCQGGGRSSIAASLMQAHGVPGVMNLAGGFGAWQGSGLSVTATEGGLSVTATEE